jgi:hypothetical protein
MFAVWSWGVGGGDIVGMCWLCLIVYDVVVILEGLSCRVPWVRFLMSWLVWMV